MGIEDKWKSFIEMTRAKAEFHEKSAQYWDRVHNALTLILVVIAALTTMFTLLPVSEYIGPSLAGVTTVLSAVIGSINPGLKRQQQLEASKSFRALMLKMLRVETEREYEELWKDYDKKLLDEPYIPVKYKVEKNAEFCMSEEFLVVVARKEADVRGMTSDLGSSTSIKLVENPEWDNGNLRSAMTRSLSQS